MKQDEAASPPSLHSIFGISGSAEAACQLLSLAFWEQPPGQSLIFYDRQDLILVSDEEKLVPLKTCDAGRLFCFPTCLQEECDVLSVVLGKYKAAPEMLTHNITCYIHVYIRKAPAGPPL